MRATIGILACVLLVGCRSTAAIQRSMDAYLDIIVLPSEFVLVSKRQGGQAFHIAAGPEPFVERFYAAPWDSGRLCGRLLRLASEHGSAQPIKANPCGYFIDVPRDRIRPRSKVSFMAEAPNSSFLTPNENTCRQEREYLALHPGDLWFRVPACFIPLGQAVLRMRMTAYE